jgi:hypothetical protein
MYCSSQESTAGDTFETVDLPAAGELYPSGASDGVKGQTMDGSAVATDGEAHWLVAVESIVAGQGSGATCAADVPLNILQIPMAGSRGRSYDLNPCSIAPDQVLATAMQGEPFRCHQSMELLFLGHEVWGERHP